jgi:hypothetical protein
MSGHYLGTENPALAAELTAAEVVQPAAEVLPEPIIEAPDFSHLPDLGTPVVYICRPGEGRAGKTEFPATVMHHEPDGTLYLMVFYDSDDIEMRQRVRKNSDTVDWPAWRFVENQGPVVIEHEPFEPTRLNMLRADVDRMRAGIYGSYEEPGKSVMEFLVSFEEKLGKLEKRLKALEKAK